MPGSSVTATGFVALVVIQVDGQATQRTLVDMLARDVEAWVRHCPGFLSATYHMSVDGTQVVNYAEWSDEAAYRESFDLNPDKEAMRKAIRELPGVLDGPKMTGFVPDRRITLEGSSSHEGAWTAADALRKGAMQLGSRLRLEHPVKMPAPDELQVLVTLTNHGAATVEQLAQRSQIAREVVETVLAKLTSAGLAEGPAGDRHYQISASGQQVLDEGRRMRTEWLAEGMIALEFNPLERELLRLAAPLMERLARR